MDKSELLKLAERVEALRWPDREVDAEIAAAIHTDIDGIEFEAFVEKDGKVTIYFAGGKVKQVHRAPAYTASLDAAMTLVERPAWVRIDEWPDEFNATSASVQPIRDPQVGSHCAKAASPAPALCAAALRALAKEDS